jgi:hypothetical protein
VDGRRDAVQPRADRYGDRAPLPVQVTQ